MTEDTFRSYLAGLYGIEKDAPRLVPVIQMAIESLGAKKPWSWARRDVTLTTDANGIITFESDFDGALAVRERDSSAGRWIYVWSDEKFDDTFPRLDNLSGSYPGACKIQKVDGEWQAQMAPPIEGMSIYVLYKTVVSGISEIPDKCLDLLVAIAHSLMIKPSEEGYLNAQIAVDQKVKRAWKEDRVNWAGIFKTFNEADVREYVRWDGVWQW